MKKKLLLIILVLVTLTFFASCEKNYDPDPAVEQYLNTGLSAEKAFEKLAKVSYTTTLSVQNKSGDEQGSQTSIVNFDVTDKDNLSLTIQQTFSGSCIINGVTEQTSRLFKQNDGYVYKTETNVDIQNSEREVDGEFALNLITALVYTDNGAYNDNGLYYGDIFMLKIYKFPAESFYVDTETDMCVFDEKMLIIRDDLGNVHLYQTTKINRLGLLEYDYEKYESESQDSVLISEVSAQYEYVSE